ncbi:MAG: beta strand repeat-containing protein [Candidatus Kapaibacterium sp.]
MAGLRSFLLLILLSILSSGFLIAQNRDFNAERLIIDDDAGDGTRNTMTIQTPLPLPQNVILTIPDIGSDTAFFLLAPPGSRGAWLLSGNAGTIPGTDFVGTTDATALHLYVNQGASNSLILNTNRSIQRDTGGDPRGNSAVDLQIARTSPPLVASGSFSAVLGGQGNSATASFSTVAGGAFNNATGSNASIGGGLGNNATGNSAGVAAGNGNSASNSFAFVGGGVGNNATGLFSVISGGERNNASGTRATVGGGMRNTVSGNYSVVVGGRGLVLGATATGSFGFLGGNSVGFSGSGSNAMAVDSQDVAVFGNTDMWLANNDGRASRLLFYEANSTTGNFPPATAFYTSFEAGNQTEDITYILPTTTATTGTPLHGVLQLDTATGQLSWLDPAALASSGGWNLTGNGGTTPGTDFVGTTDPTPLHFYVNGGSSNSLILNINGSIQRDTGGNARGNGAVDLQMVRTNSSEVASGSFSAILGGQRNSATADFSTVAGGLSNNATGANAFVGGGVSNSATAVNTGVAAGNGNSATNNLAFVGGGTANSATGLVSTISGGEQNNASGARSTVGGGMHNNASGDYSVVVGGRGLTLGATATGSFGFLGGNSVGAGGSGSKAMTVDSQDVAVFGNTDLWLANNDGMASRLLFFEANSTSGIFPPATAFYTSFEAGSQTSDINYILPTTTTATFTVEDGVLQLDAGTGQLSWVDPAAISTSGWSLTGNAGTTSGTNYVGTSDAQAFHIYVNGGASNSLVLNTNSSIQRGTTGDARGSNAVDLQIVRGSATQVASGGGSTVSGGINNTASGLHSSVGGGTTNTASGRRSVVSGGEGNVASGVGSYISGGTNNTSAGDNSSIVGGQGMTLTPSADNSFGFYANPVGLLTTMSISEPKTAVFANADLWLANNEDTASQLRFYEKNNTTGSFPNSTNYTSFEAGDQSEDINYILPTARPTANGQVLSSDTNGVMSWANGSSSAQSFSNSSNAVSTLLLDNNVGTNDGVALEITEGSVILSNAQGGAASIPDDVAIYDVNDGIAASAPTVGLPAAGVNGKILYIYVSDPDGASVGGTARASGNRLTYIYISGGWKLFHVN